MIKQKILSYLQSNPKQCGINEKTDIIKLKKDIKKLNLFLNNDLFFDIIRECIYRKNISHNSFFSKSVWYSIFSENTMNKCICCKNKLKSVNWNCCDIYCNNCKIKYEVKSKLSIFPKIKQYTQIKVGNILGVIDFLKDNNCILIHFLDGYYYSFIEDIKTKMIIKCNNNIFKNMYCFKNWLKTEKIQELNFEQTKNIKTTIMIPNHLLIKYNNSNHYYDLNPFINQIKEIDKIYHCITPHQNIDNLLENFKI